MSATSPAETDRATWTVTDVLNHFRGQRIFLSKVSGNNGDDLIFLGAQHAIEQQGGILVQDLAEADLHCVNGGFKSDFWPFANGLVRDACAEHPDRPLVILPSTYSYEKSDFAALFAGRRAPVWVFAREPRSLELLRELNFPCEAFLGLDHDMAWALRDAPWVLQQRQRATDEHVLVVERGDHESATGLREERSGLMKAAIRAALKVVSRPVLQMVAARVGRARSSAVRTGRPFTAAAQRRVAELHPEFAGLPLMVADIARRGVCDFDGYVDAVARAAVVVTTRLHVGILAALLDKPTLLVAGPTHKIPGVHGWSLADVPHVRLVDAACRDVDPLGTGWIERQTTRAAEKA